MGKEAGDAAIFLLIGDPALLKLVDVLVQTFVKYSIYPFAPPTEYPELVGDENTFGAWGG
jgi:hypothetical protein